MQEHRSFSCSFHFCRFLWFPVVSCALGFGAFIRLEQVNLSSCGFGSWKTCSKEFVQGLFFHHLAGSGPPKTPAREIDQGIFHSSRKICARDPFRDWWPTTWPDRGSGSRNVDREKKESKGANFPKKKKHHVYFLSSLVKAPLHP